MESPLLCGMQPKRRQCREKTVLSSFFFFLLHAYTVYVFVAEYISGYTINSN